MSDREDASRDEHMARLDAALERLKSPADVEASLHFDRMLDETATFSWPPAPNTEHPAWSESAAGIRALIKRRDRVIYYAKPRRMSLSLDMSDEVEPGPMEMGAFQVRMCSGPAPYTDTPFVWVWKVAVDEANRWVAGESWPEYHPHDPWRRA